MIPMISSITLLPTLLEKNTITPRMAQAPAIAPATVAMYPPKEPTVPPKASITRATPRLAPSLIPRMDGPARGLWKRVCSSRPLTARAAPASRAVAAWGRREPVRMMLQAGLSPPPPRRMSSTSPGGIGTAP